MSDNTIASLIAIFFFLIFIGLTWYGIYYFVGIQGVIITLIFYGLLYLILDIYRSFVSIWNKKLSKPLKD